MKHSVVVQQVAGFFTLLLVSSLWLTPTLFADAIVDREFDDNQNDLEYYWYYYEDNSGVGPNDRPQLFPNLKPSVIEVPYVEKERHAFNDAADNWNVKVYKFQTSVSMSKKCATVPFVFGDPWEAEYCSKGKACAMPFVGIGTMLNKEGVGLDLTGAKKVRFYAKSRVQDLKEVMFKIETLDINTYSNKRGSEMEGDEFGYFGQTVAILKGDWQLFEIIIADLDRPSWSHEFAFDITKCTKIAWEVKGDGKMTRDTLDIADVSIVGDWEFIPPSLWVRTETAKPADGMLFSDFDQAPFNQARSPLNYYWYAYNDADITGTSIVEPQFATINDLTGKLDIKFIAETGSDNAGQGAALGFTLGKPVPKDSLAISGFVGIGINLYDSAKVKYWNADSADKNAVYFEYFTDGEVKHLSLELSDSNDVGDKVRYDRKDKRGSGIVNYRNFPPTGGVWKKVLIPFDSLVTHDTWAGYTAIPLDKKALAKIQWKVQGPEGTAGKFAIDNVIFLKAVLTGVQTGRHLAIRSGAENLYVDFRGGMVFVGSATSSLPAIGMFSLVNMRGQTVLSAPLRSSGGRQALLPAENLPAGMYLARVSGRGRSGNAVSQQSAVTIVK